MRMTVRLATIFLLFTSIAAAQGIGGKAGIGGKSGIGGTATASFSIAHDADANSGGSCGNVSSCTWNHTVGVTAHPFLWVAFSMNSGFNNPSVSSVTYNSVGMTAVTGSPVTNGTFKIYAYYLANPSTG